MARGATGEVRANAPGGARFMREQQKSKDIDRRVKVLYGALVSTMALAEPQGEQLDVSAAIAKVAPLLTDKAALPGRDFGELVRARKHALGLPVQVAESSLPFYAPEPQDAPPDPAMLDQEPPEDDTYAHAWWRMELAERRMHEALSLISKDSGGNNKANEREEAELVHEVVVLSTCLTILEIQCK
jgi:hypothetical protein